jgi:hypothetical protein
MCFFICLTPVNLMGYYKVQSGLYGFFLAFPNVFLLNFFGA